MNETEARGTAFCEVVAAAVAAVAAAAAGGAGGSVSYDSSMITPCVFNNGCRLGLCQFLDVLLRAGPGSQILT